MFFKKDLKMFLEKEFLEFLCEKNFGIKEYYPKKNDLVFLYSEFIKTKNFEVFMKSKFNFYHIKE